MAAQFSGEPQTIWLTDPNRNDRRMKLIDEFWFDDRSGDRWSAPADYVVDGASIPRALWTLVGSPYTGQYRRASIVHDKACDDFQDDPDGRRAADRMFFEACRAGGCTRIQAMILYAGVRVGSAWSTMDQDLMGMSTQDDGPTLVRPPHEQQMIRDFQYLAEQLTLPGETDDPKEVEDRADGIEQRMHARRAAMIAGF
jgi:hypothetical protein